MKSLLFVMILKSTLALLLRPIAPFRTTTVKLFSSQPARKFRSFPFPYHSEMVVEIESLTSLGQGVARVPLPAADAESHDGENRWVVFVPSVLPGETVRVRVFRNDKTFSDADLVEVITPSPDRVEPKCKLYTECGGCQYQHISIAQQRRFKQQQVVDVFARHNYLDCEGDILKQHRNSLPVAETIGTDEQYGYRSKITPHYNPPPREAEFTSDAFGPIGFHRKSSRMLVDVDKCIIATDHINRELNNVRKDVVDGWGERVKFLEEKNKNKKPKNRRKGLANTLMLREVYGGKVVSDPNQVVREVVNGMKFEFKAGNFWQNNPFLLPKMVDHVIDRAFAGVNNSSTKSTHLIDTYCGSGLFAICAAKKFEQVAGIEVNAMAIDEAKRNAILNDIGNASFLAAEAEKIFDTDVRDYPRDETTVICDPPRKGVR